MNLQELQQRLLEAGRTHAPSDSVPYAFEKRVLARLHHLPAMDTWTLWNRVLWRAAAPCVAVTLLTGAWSWLAVQEATGPDNLAVELETTVCAPLASGQEPW